MSVSALARSYPISVTAVQKHIAVLERAELVTKVRRGREQLVQSRLDGVATGQRVLDDLVDVWRGRIDRIGDLVADHNEGARE